MMLRLLEKSDKKSFSDEKRILLTVCLPAPCLYMGCCCCCSVSLSRSLLTADPGLAVRGFRVQLCLGCY